MPQRSSAPGSLPSIQLAGALVLCLVLLLGTEAQSRETGARSLDGRTFHGEIRDEKGIVRYKDVLTFKDGQFQSEKCREFGFGDSPYWTRVEQGVVHFLVESANPSTGEMVFKGEVRGDQVEWKGAWTKKRWYWTLSRDVSFTGTQRK